MRNYTVKVYLTPMKKHTFKERLEAGLLVFGWSPSLAATKKYSRWVKPGRENLWVGKAGALRAGECVSDSHSIGDPGSLTIRYRLYLHYGDKVLAHRDLPREQAAEHVRNYFQIELQQRREDAIWQD